jgi:pyruvate carboxylase
MALFIVSNNLDEKNFFENAKNLSFPASVISMMKGELGFPPGGFPKHFREIVLKHQPKKSLRIPKMNLSQLKTELGKKLESGLKNGKIKTNENDVMSYAMYPQATVDYLNHKVIFGDTSVLPTATFFFGLQPGEEIDFDIEEGKTLYIKLIAISETDVEGMKTVFFELNGNPRDVEVRDQSYKLEVSRRSKADPENLHQVGSPMPGRVTHIFVKPGDPIQKGDKLFMLEAMKMETSIVAARSGKTAAIYVKSGDIVDSGDLIMAYQ